MKRKLCTLLTALLLIVPAFAAGQHVSVDSIGLSVDVPDDFGVFTQEMDPSAPQLAQFGFTYDACMQTLKDNNIVLQAIAPDQSYSVVVNVFEDSRTRGEVAYLQLSDEELTKMAENLVAAYEKNGVSCKPITLYTENPAAKFMRIELTGSTGDTTTPPVIQYATVVGGRGVHFTLLEPKSGAFTDEMDQTLLSVVRSAAFRADASVATETDFTPLIVIVFAIVLLGVFLRRKRRKVAAKPKE